MKTLIACALLLALIASADAAPKSEWFLTFDIAMCSRFGCGGPRGDKQPTYTELVDSEAYATKKQCLAMGIYLEELAKHGSYEEDYQHNPLFARALAPYSIAPDQLAGGVTKKVTFRCEQSREH